MSQSISTSEEYQGRANGDGSRASWSSHCRHKTGLSVRQLVKSMVLVMMCRKALYRLESQAVGQEHGHGNDVQEGNVQA